MKASKEYIQQHRRSILITTEEISFTWQERQELIKQIKRFKKQHFDKHKGYEVYCPDSCLHLNNMQERLKESNKLIAELHRNLWKTQKNLEMLES